MHSRIGIKTKRKRRTPLQATCDDVEGCGSSDLLSNAFGGLRRKRHITIEEIRAALAANPDLQRQIQLMNRFGTQGQTTSGSIMKLQIPFQSSFSKLTSILERSRDSDPL